MIRGAHYGTHQFLQGDEWSSHNVINRSLK